MYEAGRPDAVLMRALALPGNVAGGLPAHQNDEQKAVGHVVRDGPTAVHAEVVLWRHSPDDALHRDAHDAPVVTVTGREVDAREPLREPWDGVVAQPVGADDAGAARRGVSGTPPLAVHAPG